MGRSDAAEMVYSDTDIRVEVYVFYFAHFAHHYMSPI
jgi:hypothetical protein